MIKRLAQRLFQWFCHPDYVDEIQGDLEELYQRNVEQSGRMAQWKYFSQVLGLLRLSIIRPFQGKSGIFNIANSLLMIRYYFKFALRRIRFNTSFSLINIIGLGIGLASCILIFQYLSHEWSFDKFHTDYQSIYRIKHDRYQEGAVITESATTFSQIAQELRQTYPSVETACRLHKAGESIAVQAGENLFWEDQIIGADTTFFNIFSFHFLYGAPETALTSPNAIVLTTSAARKYFGETDPLGQEIIIDGAYGAWKESGYESRSTYIVTGVIEDLPTNTHLDFDLLVSFSKYSNLENELDNWGDSFYTYFKLSEPSAVSTITAGLSTIVDKYRPDRGITLSLQPMQEIHLTSNLVNELKGNGSEANTWLLAAVAILILIVAGTNYINFFTAQAIRRQKEVSVRKIYWASSAQLFRQVMAEAFLLNVFALFLAAALIGLAHPFLLDALNVDLTGKITTPQFWAITLIITVGGTLISGLYPAFFVARLSTQRMIRTGERSFLSPSKVRQSLVTFQFVVSVLVIGCAIVLYSQMDFMRNKDLGISIDKTLVINGPSVGVANDSTYINRLESFKVEAQRLSAISDITLANFIPGNKINGEASGYVRRVGSRQDQASTYYFSQIDYEFISDFSIPIIAGREFNPAYATDQDAIIINRAACRLLGFASAEEAIDQSVVYRMNTNPTIIGVVDNFHQYGLQRDFQPIIFEVDKAPQTYCYLKLSENNVNAELRQVKQLWEELFPGNPFSYFFLNDYYARQYTRDTRFANSFGIFAVLAMLVATMGFFGLMYYAAVNRTKEIGIRKTLGAQLGDIVLLLGRRTVTFVLIAVVISVPITYYTAEQWLLDYA
ncbi:MAG: ABC transporter permease, partial [Tunicatimonas sp.]|uniref:ABC transporter permease n=1 Tax=Tunicatimonas sp. TaxID=1940096 RepID=UPI003C748FD4